MADERIACSCGKTYANKRTFCAHRKTCQQPLGVVDPVEDEKDEKEDTSGDKWSDVGVKTTSFESDVFCLFDKGFQFN